MAEHIRARHLMLRTFSTISEEQTLGEARQALLETQRSDATPNAVVVTDGDGRYLGVLTARLFFRSLLNVWMPSRSVREDDPSLEAELLEVVRDRDATRVHDALIRGLPAAAPEDRLLKLIELSCDKQLGFVPVVVDGKPVGLVPVTAIFQAAAELALTPEHEGIHFDQQ